MSRYRDMILRDSRRVLALGAWVAMAVIMPQPALPAAQPASFLDGIHRQTTLSSTVPDNGDQNPYAIVVAPVSAGSVQKDDVLITNFNDAGNLQGLGTTIVNYNPTTKKLTTFAALPRDLRGCPGGVGLSTAMTMLKTGWVIVGSAPSADGTTATRGAGCLIVLDVNGKVAGTIVGDKINMPWGNMAVIDEGQTATLFVSNAGFGVGSPEGDPRVVNEATVLRIKLSIPEGKPPEVVDQTVIGSGFGSQPNKDVFLIGPTGLALGPNDTLYVSDATGNRISAIWDATTRDHSAGVGRTITKDGLLQTPLAMATAPNGHLLVVNAKNGQVVEIDPASGEQIKARWIDPNKAQKPPGSGDLFGIAMTPSGDGFLLRRGRVEHARAGAMSCPFGGGSGPSRRGLLAGAGGLLAGAGIGKIARAASPEASAGAAPAEMFFGPHQGGIATAQQTNSYFAAFDLLAKTRDEVTAMLRLWTEAAARMTSGETARPLGEDLSVEGPDGASALGLGPVAPDHHLRLRRRAVHQGRRRPLRPCRQTARGARRSAEIQRRPIAARAHRRRHFGAGLRRRSAGRVSRGARAGSSLLWRGADPLGADGLPASHVSRRNAAQPDGLQGWHEQSSARRRPNVSRCPPGLSTTSSGLAKRGPTGCEAAAISLRAESGFRSSIGIEPRSTFRSR